MKKKIAFGHISFMTVVMVLLVVFFVIGCTTVPQNDGSSGDGSGSDGVSNDAELKTFSSEREVREFLERQVGDSDYSRSSFGISNAMFTMEESVSMDTATTSAAPRAMTESAVQTDGADDFSTTNVQVEGVDEADFVKNDGKYIYLIADGKLVIVNAFPAEDAEIVYEEKLSENRAQELFVQDDRLVVISNSHDMTFYIPEYDVIPRERYTQVTNVKVFDIADRAKPVRLKDYDVTGYYVTSRMVGDDVYVITHEGAFVYGGVVPLPRVMEGGDTIISPEIHYYDVPGNGFTFTTISSFDVGGLEVDVTAESFMIDNSHTVYMSHDNIYLTHQKFVPYGGAYAQERFYEIIVPVLPDDVQHVIFELKYHSTHSEEEKWEQIRDLIEDMYNDMDTDEKQATIEKIAEAVEEYELKRMQELRKTVIHRIAVSEGEISYKAKGEVNGHLLNQFSLDEFDSHLRVATTTQVWGRGISEQYNNVFTLDMDLNMIGSLEDIAPDERIFSTRFMGDRLYMVTFRQVDPFFVIDLSDHKKPAVLGELKIPGFSNYLHPFDENHIIGVGRETKENDNGGFSITGLKLALFDVSDVTSPRQVDVYEIEGRSTDSEALYDHRAFLFDRSRELLVIPVREVNERVYDSGRGYYRWKVEQGAHVFNVNAQDGFSLQGRVTHSEDDENTNYYHRSQATVRRSLYMDDVLYTISGKFIKMNDVYDISREVNSVALSVSDKDIIGIEEPIAVLR